MKEYKKHAEKKERREETNVARTEGTGRETWTKWQRENYKVK
jgi:hypothetical protein